MMPTYQANTGGFNSAPTAGSSGNWVVDGANQILDVIGRGASIFTDIEDAKTRNEVAKLNTSGQPAPVSSAAQPNQIALLNDAELKRIVALVGGGIVLVGGIAFLMSRSK